MSILLRFPLPKPPHARGTRGAVLLLVLILLAVFLVALAAAVGSSVNNLASVGNYSYHDGAIAVSDSVVADAKTFIQNASDATLGVVATTTATVYSPIILPDTNGDGVPVSPCSSGGWSCVPTDATTYAGYRVQYVIERLCTSAGVVTVATAQAQCQTGKPSSLRQQISVGGAPALTLTFIPVLYRVTVKATGPRAAAVLTQTIISKSVSPQS